MNENDIEREAWVKYLSHQKSRSDKDWGLALCLAILLGGAGIDRFYLGYPGIGLIKFFTMGGFGILWVYDFTTILLGYIKDSDGLVLLPPWKKRDTK